MSKEKAWKCFKMLLLFLHSVIFHFLYEVHFLHFLQCELYSGKKSFKNGGTGLSDFEGTLTSKFSLCVLLPKNNPTESTVILKVEIL